MAQAPGEQACGEGGRSPGPRAAGGWREFVSTVVVVATARRSGVGLELGAVVDAELRACRSSLEDGAREAGAAPEAFSDEHARRRGDVCVWEGDKVVAVVRPCVGGPPEVVEFAPARRTRPPRPVVEVDRGGGGGGGGP